MVMTVPVMTVIIIHNHASRENSKYRQGYRNSQYQSLHGSLLFVVVMYKTHLANDKKIRFSVIMYYVTDSVFNNK
jgi:hypothetical protein